MGKWTITALFVAAAAILFFLIDQDQKRWIRFSTDHHCVVIGHKADQTFTTVSPDGTISTGSISGQTGYKCDDGVEYWR